MDRPADDQEMLPSMSQSFTQQKLEQLVEEAVAGDDFALQELLVRHCPQLTAHLDRQFPGWLRESVCVDDVLQDTFVSVFRSITSFEARDEGSFFAWLARIADCRLADTIRTFQRKKRGGDLKRNRSPERSGVADLLDLLSTDMPTPSRVATRQENEQALRLAIAHLPSHYRQAVTMHYIEGHAVNDVARELGKTPAAIRGMLTRAREEISTIMGNASQYLSR